MRYLEMLDAVAGSSVKFKMEHRIFNFAIAISIATIIPSLFFMLFQGSWIVTVFLFIVSLLYFYIYRLCRFINQLQKAVLVFSFVGAVLLNVMWIADRGAMGSAAFFIFVAILIITFTAEAPLKYIVALVINLNLLCIFGKMLQTLFPWKVPVSEIGQQASLVSAVAYLSILALFYKQLIHRKMDQTYLDVMSQLGVESAGVNQTSDSLAASSEQLLAAALQQKSATEQLSVTTEELGATAEQNKLLATSAMSSIKATDNNLVMCNSTIHSLVDSIEKINQSSKEIKTINSVINDLAFQTNILSLNAMIEASRAEGSNGGFKVVALEVKRLAERSAQAVEGIDNLLDNNFKTVQESVAFAEDMKKRFQEISASMLPLVSTIQNVSDASVEQHEAIRQIIRGIEDIDRAVDENKNLAGKSTDTAQELKENARALIQVVEMLQEVVHSDSHFSNERP